MDQLADAAGDEADAVFVGLHLFRNPDQHRSTLASGLALLLGSAIGKLEGGGRGSLAVRAAVVRRFVADAAVMPDAYGGDKQPVF